MRVKHNLNAMTASRQLNATLFRQGGTTEKLSSGLKINRAGDDAAGLSISEKMRSQIRDLIKVQEMDKMVFHLFRQRKVLWMKFIQCCKG